MGKSHGLESVPLEEEEAGEAADNLEECESCTWKQRKEQVCSANLSNSVKDEVDVCEGPNTEEDVNQNL